MGKNKLNINLLIENSHPALMPSVVARVSGPNSYNSPDLLSDEHISKKKKKHFPLTHVSLKHTHKHTYTQPSHSRKLTLFLSFICTFSLPSPSFHSALISFFRTFFSLFSPFPSFPLSTSLPLTFSIFPFSQPHSSSLSFSLSQIIHPSPKLPSSFYPSATIRSQSSTRHTVV